MAIGSSITSLTVVGLPDLDLGSSAGSEVRNERIGSKTNVIVGICYRRDELTVKCVSRELVDLSG